MVDFGTAVRRFYANYTVADGRSPRAEYWWVALFEAVIGAVLLTVVYMAEGGPEFLQSIWDAFSGDTDNLDGMSGLGVSGIMALTILTFFGLVNFLPGIMLKIRRFHDLDQSGWLVLVFWIVGIFPVIGTVASLGNIIWYAIPGTQGSNKYGPDPYGYDNDVFG